jgi:hypothetical protein
LYVAFHGSLKRSLQSIRATALDEQRIDHGSGVLAGARIR